MKFMGQVVLYLRVSKDTQLHGIDAQLAFVNVYLQRTGDIVLRVFKEVESGYNQKRPEFLKAKRLCKRTGAKLLFSTMDRLTRYALLVAGLMIDKIKFIAADKPDATDLDHLEDACRSQREGDKIRKRTKEGLQVAKAKGVELGKNGKVLAAKNKLLADDFARIKGPIIQALRDEGLSFQEIADKWNKEGELSFREGCKWHASTVYETWKRSTTLTS